MQGGVSPERAREAVARPDSAARVPLGERLAGLGLLNRESIPAILRAQLRWGCRFGDAALAQGILAPAALAEGLSAAENIPYTDLIADPPDEALCREGELDLYLKHLFLPWRLIGETPVIACADPSPALRAVIGNLYGPRALLAITSKFDVIWSVQRLFREKLGFDAAHALDKRTPEFSARHVMSLPQLAAIMGAAGFALSAAYLFPLAALAAFLTAISLCYAINIVFRVVLFALAGAHDAGLAVSHERLAALDERDLPVYTIIAPLYREAHMVGPLVTALKQLDYPGLMAQTPHESGI